jgi:hypothetical protein
MRYFQNHISRFIAFLIAFQILNMSIDSPSAQMELSSGSTDNFNYIDTYVEFVAEVILKYDNAIPETQNRQQKELQMQKQFELVFQKIEPVKLLFFTQQIEKRFISYSNKYAFQFIKEINPPPPKA